MLAGKRTEFIIAEHQPVKPTMKSTNIRIGAVSYLNTKPLVEGLAELAPSARLSFDLPSRLAKSLAENKLDVALIPSIEYLRNENWTIVSDACIGCLGPVLSVKLLTRKPFADIETLALDEGSRTSAALVQILLAEHGVRPTLETLPIGSSVNDTSADAVLLIGDRAIHSPQGGFIDEWDLGEQWRRTTGLPFVFAMWVARPGVNVSSIEPALEAARDLGVANLNEIAARHADEVNLSHESCLSYLRDNLYFHLKERQQKALELYYRRAADIGLAPANFELRFYDSQTT